MEIVLLLVLTLGAFLAGYRIGRHVEYLENNNEKNDRNNKRH
jgi:hypothetical protein